MSAEALEVEDWLHVIRSEYEDMPGLSLTVTQAQRLWGLSPTVCRALLEALVTVKFLRHAPGGAYVQVEAAAETGESLSSR